MEFRIAYPNELYHHGIKGQKWGVRRYQRPDGTLTKAGEKRYHKRLVEKAVIIGQQANTANTIMKRAKKKSDAAQKRARENPTDKNLRKATESKRVYDARVKEFKEWEKTFNSAVKDAKQNVSKIEKIYGKTKLKAVPEDVKSAGRKYVTQLMKHGLPGQIALGVVGGAITQSIGARHDRQIAEYFRDQQR